MKLKTAIKKLRKGEIQIHYDNGDLKGLNKVLLGAFPGYDKAGGSNEFYLKWDGGWSGYFTKKTNLPIVKLSEIDFSKKSKLEKRVENLETILKDHLRLDHNKIDTGWTDGGRLTVANLEDKPSPLKPEDLVTGKWYVDEDGDYLKYIGITDDKTIITVSEYFIKFYRKEISTWRQDLIREALQEELDSFLPEGHPDRSDSKLSNKEIEEMLANTIPSNISTKEFEKAIDDLKSTYFKVSTQPSDFNTNTKYRKKGDVCLCWNDGSEYKGSRIWNNFGFDSDTCFNIDNPFDNHQFLGVNIFD